MNKKRAPLTPVVRFRLFMVILGMLMIWYYAQMLVYAEVLFILERLSSSF